MADSELQKAVNKVLLKEPLWKKAIEPPAPAQPIPAARGTGASNIAAKGAGGTASASLTYTETAYADRTYWPDRTFRSTDGLITFVEGPIKSVKMLDGANNPVSFIWAQPPA